MCIVPISCGSIMTAMEILEDDWVEEEWKVITRDLK